MDNLFDDPKLLEQTTRELRNLLDNMKTNGESLVGSVKLQKLKEINEFSKKFKKALELSKGIKFSIEETLLTGTIDITTDYDELIFDEPHLKLFSELFTNYYVGVANDWDFFSTGIAKPQLSFTFYNCFNTNIIKGSDSNGV